MAQEILKPDTEKAQQLPWVPILMYHRVVPEVKGDDPYGLCSTVREFDAQMRFLASEGYRSTTLEELASPPSDAGRRKERCVAITFDDGYLDVFQNAAPILEKYGFSATMFLVTDYLGRTNEWDQGKVEQVPLLDTGEIDQMQRSNFTFGSHSRTHRPLAQIARDEAWAEIAGSKEWFRNELGIDATTLCYPYGSTSPEVMKMAREAGYVAACGIDRLHNSLFDLSRIDAAACRGTSLTWRLKVSGVHRKVRSNSVLRSLKRLVAAGGSDA